MASEYADLFDFRWLATPQECCEYHDLSWLIAQYDSALLANDGWVPDILVIDYALTQDTRTVASHVDNDVEWLARLSPLPTLRDRAKSLFKEPPVHRPAFPGQPDAGREFWGCFIGGLLLNTFADHPCGPVTITRYTEETLCSKSLDAAFFEWLVDVPSGGGLQARGSKSPPWQETLPTGVRGLKKRLASLAGAGIVRVSLEDLLALIENGSHPVLTTRSRYGRRRYPVAGLFTEVPVESRAAAVSEWAESLLRKIWDAKPSSAAEQPFKDALRSVIQGRALAESVWQAYDSEEFQDHFEARMRLSELLVHSDRLGGVEKLDEDSDAELRGLLVRFGVSDPNSQLGCSKAAWDLRAHTASGSTDAVRWAVLFTITRLLHRRRLSLGRYRELPDDLLPHDRLDLGKRVGVEDVYLALFPIPSNPLRLKWHDAENRNAANAWEQFLRRNGVNASKIVKGQGIGSQERLIMQMFAESIGFGNWATDENLQTQDILGTPGPAEG